MISGFTASDIGQIGIEDFSWGTRGGSAASPWDVGGGESPFWNVPFADVWPSVIDALGKDRYSGTSFPVVPSLPAVPDEGVRVIGTPQGILLDQDPGDPTVVSPRPAPAVPSVLDDAWMDDAPITGVGYAAPEQETGMGWGDLFQQVASTYVATKYAPSPVRSLVAAAQPSQSGFINIAGDSPPTATPAAAVMQNGSCSTCPPSGARYSKICNATGEVTPLRRRRRRKLLTSGDLQSIASLKAIVGGGAALNAIVVKAMR